ncbi:ABC transporter related protein [Pseudodesulfovibrio profundus]|uniref:ABC transporter related protein n=1 Tax=Pseudodesulfovibrio profundus TaxID=57320 RepID=A0A2C8FA72_9BACT|nr:ATP-binding cassette domain-containing protein [Pseudodesulfovibrio profundus]MBC15977.1 ABC transporter ATP-binding protein [Desulfovibrio sp.]SOB59399.1 ABC transporter related protein [Pseudodesulfovibrio profundus]|tara:strand:- start:7156 stop:8007 length:852 start_codon:yes stop_codon:yes gene_type:complete
MSAPSIRTEKLAIGYGEKVIAKDLDLEFPGNKLSMIVGGSGSGKSTLLRHILNLQPPLGGKIFIGGHDISDLTRNERHCIRQRTGVLFQDGALLGSLRVKDNMALPLREHTRLSEKQIMRIVEDRLTMVGLGHAMELFPNELSGGMRKRAGLARALVMDPQVLFCDEPTSGLDPVMSAELDHLLLDMMCNFDMTMIVVTHDLPSMRNLADHVVVLGEQRALFQGDIETLKKTEDPYLRSFLDRAAPERSAPRLTLPPLSQDVLKRNCDSIMGEKDSAPKDRTC